jgi:hypothetical protein
LSTPGTNESATLMRRTLTSRWRICRAMRAGKTERRARISAKPAIISPQMAPEAPTERLSPTKALARLPASPDAP